jgi:hypothetical protein
MAFGHPVLTWWHEPAANPSAVSSSLTPSKGVRTVAPFPPKKGVTFFGCTGVTPREFIATPCERHARAYTKREEFL